MPKKTITTTFRMAPRLYQRWRRALEEMGVSQADWLRTQILELVEKKEEEIMLLKKIRRMTPNEAWETYVGAQSTSEFMDYSRDGMTPLDAALEYVRHPAFQRDMDVPEDEDVLQALASKLAAHIEECEEERS